MLSAPEKCHTLPVVHYINYLLIIIIITMWNLCITVFNSKTDEEYRVRHNVVMDHANINTVYNAGTHYSAAGRSPQSSK